MIVDELGYVPFTAVGSELLFEAFSQRYKRGTTLVTSNLPFDEWTSIFGSERLAGAFMKARDPEVTFASRLSIDIAEGDCS